MSNRTTLDPSSNDINILVVDDTPANLEVIVEILSALYSKISAVTSGKRALRKLQRITPSLILLDIQMPDMDGFETCRHIKANPDTASIPIIFITALSDTESVVKGFSLGAVDYITKPFREAELLARVQTHLNLSRLTEQLEERVNKRTAELQQALDQIQQSKLLLVQQEKMSALGNLVAGVAHEINNPIGFLNGSISNAKDYLKDVKAYLTLQQQQQPVSPVLQQKAEEIELDYVLDDFPKMLESMQMASDRIQTLSTSLRTFSRIDKQYKVSVDIHDGLDSTLLILKYRLNANEYRPTIQVIKEYGEVPPLMCFPSQLNQVFMNLLANAIDMFDEASQGVSYDDLITRPQIITIQTHLLAEQNTIEICVRDNGKGMTQDVMAKAFDHLFTTKQIGKGTGLGLAIAHQIITETHHGRIQVTSKIGQGTTFSIQIPLQQETCILRRESESLPVPDSL